jgi:hypothetical protein
MRSLFALPKLAAVAVAAMALGGGAYAFTASNTVSQAPAGMGESGAVSGYTASNVVWTPDSSNPANIQKVSFTLSTVSASTVVYAGADNGTTIGWSGACTQGTITAGAATETCTFASEPTASGVTKLAVSAAN